MSWASVRSATAEKYSGSCSVAGSVCVVRRDGMGWGGREGVRTVVVVAEVLEGSLQLGLDGFEGDDGFLLGSVWLFGESILQL